MHRRDFELVAKAISRLGDRNDRLAMARVMVPVFKRLNPAFRELRFKSACNALEIDDLVGDLFNNPTR